MTTQKTYKTEEKEDKVETIGEFLKQVREKKGFSIADISEKLCIRKVYIKAIEDGNFKELPPVPYGLGFVRSYAKFLGLNVDRIVQVYKEEHASGDKEIQVFEMPSEITYPTKKYIIGGVVAAFVVYLAFVLIQNSADKQNEEIIETQIEEIEQPIETPQKIVAEEVVAPQEETSAEGEETIGEKPVVVENQAVEETTAEEQQAEEPKVEETPQKPRVVVKVKGETWLQIKDDKEVYISKIVDNGFEYEVPNKKGIIFSVGRYYNVDVYIDGKIVEVATKRRQTNLELDKFLDKDNH